MQETIHCLHCGTAQTVAYEPDQGPQRRETLCSACARPLTLFICLYANGQAIVSLEARKTA